MYKLFFFFVICLKFSIAYCQWQYPTTKTVDSADVFFGTTYKDPYRWMENLKDAATMDWFKQQAAYTNSVLDKIPGRAALIEELKMLYKQGRTTYGTIIEENGVYFYSKRGQGENTAKLYTKKNDAETLLFDIAAYLPGKNASVARFIPNHQADKVIISYGYGGSEIQTIKVLDVNTKTFLADSIYPSRFGPLSWLPNDKGFIYSFSKTNDITTSAFKLNTQSRIHLLGDDTKNDKDIFSNASCKQLGIVENEFPLVTTVDEAPGYLFGELTNVRAQKRMYIAPMPADVNELPQWTPLCALSDELLNTTSQGEQSIIFIGTKAYSISLKNASNGKLLCTDFRNPNWEKAAIIAAEKINMVLKTIANSKNYLLLTYSDGIRSFLYKYHLANKTTTPVPLPLQAISLSVSCKDKSTDDFLITAASSTKLYVEYWLNANTNQFSNSQFTQPFILPAPYNVEIEEQFVEVKSHDGVMVPLTIRYKKGTKLNSNNICFMEAYGAYGISTLPWFTQFRALLLSKGLVLATAHVRGGGEKGKQWHVGGQKTTKPNTWKDFIACAEYLINKKYTSKDKIAAQGTSAGGILISRAITERPDLFKAVICDVGVANALRFSVANESNRPEFGNYKDSIECKALFEMDGVQHVQPNVKYPATLTTCAFNDTRVLPWMAAKFPAALQQTISDQPMLLRVGFDDGHGASNSNNAISLAGDIYSFILWQCGHPDFQMKKE
jgi:prolyl oligopeptidase